MRVPSTPMGRVGDEVPNVGMDVLRAGGDGTQPAAVHYSRVSQDWADAVGPGYLTASRWRPAHPAQRSPSAALDSGPGLSQGHATGGRQAQIHVAAKASVSEAFAPLPYETASA